MPSPKLSAEQRGLAIARVLEARFSLSVFEEMKREDPRRWHADRNDMGRGIYGEAIREKRRLHSVPDDHLEAELAAIDVRPR